MALQRLHRVAQRAPIAVVHDQPAAAGFTFLTASLFVLLTHVVHDRISQGIQHTVGGAVADDEIIRERRNILQIEQ